MNRRIRIIFWLMTCCILAIYAFQGYWLWSTYQLNRKQFIQSVQEALFQVTEGRQLAEAKKLFGNNTSGAQVDKRVLIRRFNDHSQTQTRFFYRGSTDSLSLKVKHLSADTVAKRISDILVLGWAGGERINLKKIESDYRAELRRRDIESSFKLDSLTILPEKGSGETLIFDSRAGEENIDGIVKTVPVPVNPVKHLFVQASFELPIPLLLRGMGWLLGGSVILLIVTTGCFVLMLQTILRQKRLSEVKNDFINNMTHELKTPIATVGAAVEAMLNYGVLDDRARTQHYLAISQNNLGRLSDLVEKVLNLAVEEKREMKLFPEPVNLWEMVGEMAENYQLKSKKPVLFDLQIPAGTVISVDRVHFSNVLSNLIDNAINYSYDKVTIILRFSRQETGWQLTVADNGIGISKAYQPAVFDRFFRVPTGNLHAVKGFGLGLSYVRQVVERHGGKIGVTSEPGKGSEFVLIF
jgi:two-component system, OmpR family, phosphate regulon sensor histidine kinase PhoR